MKVLFVCKGNVGRSQIAEALFNSLTKNHHAISAGTLAKSAGEKMMYRAPKNVKVLKEIGIDISKKKIKKLNNKMVNTADKIIVFCDKRSWPPFLLKSNKIEYWKSKDTNYMSYKERKQFRDNLKQKIKTLLEKIVK